MAQPTLLSYNIKGFSATALRCLCEEQGIALREVRPEEYGVPVGALAGIPVAGPTAGGSVAPFEDPMLVMCHMLSDQLNAFLRGLRESAVPPVALKAVLTPSNVTWNSRRLRDELAREHEAMRGRSLR